MCKISYRRHRFPPVIIQHAVWLYCRFTLSYRDVEDLLAERGLDISYETVRRWVLKFGRAYARRIRRRRPRPTERWHLDEMVVIIRGRRFYLWRAVDSEGEVLDFLIQSRRNTKAAIRLMRKLRSQQPLNFGPTAPTRAAWRCEHDGLHPSISDLVPPENLVPHRILGLSAERRIASPACE